MSVSGAESGKLLSFVRDAIVTEGWQIYSLIKFDIAPHVSPQLSFSFFVRNTHRMCRPITEVEKMSSNQRNLMISESGNIIVCLILIFGIIIIFL